MGLWVVVGMLIKNKGWYIILINVQTFGPSMNIGNKNKDEHNVIYAT